MKRILCMIGILILFLYFIISPKDALDASRQGLTLWFDRILPTLLPFSILSYIVLWSGMINPAGRQHKYISTMEWYIILCGFLFGFPIGSKLTADLYHEGLITKRRAEILCCFTNNLSPVFVSAVLPDGLNALQKSSIYVLLYGIPFGYGMIRLLCIRDSQIHKNTASRFQMNMQIVDAGIINGFETLIKICGYIMIFSILANMLRVIPWSSSMYPLIITGFLEVTNGMAMIPTVIRSNSMEYLLSICFLAANGISGLFQTASILSATDLSMRHYFIQKLLLLNLIFASGCLLLFAFRFC